MQPAEAGILGGRPAVKNGVVPVVPAIRVPGASAYTLDGRRIAAGYLFTAAVRGRVRGGIVCPSLCPGLVIEFDLDLFCVAEAVVYHAQPQVVFLAAFEQFCRRALIGSRSDRRAVIHPFKAQAAHLTVRVRVVVFGEVVDHTL